MQSMVEGVPELSLRGGLYLSPLILRPSHRESAIADAFRRRSVWTAAEGRLCPPPR
jgi:hypothetical protein